MSALGSILIGVAAKVGAPLVKNILEKHFGGTAGEIGGSIIDAIAEKAGVTPDELADVSEKDLAVAVRQVEAEAPEILAHYVESQRLANELMRDEMVKSETAWTWAWRPAWMWFLGFLWLWRLVAVPTLDAAMGSQLAGAIDLTVLAWLTTVYTGLYMGGHTVKAGIETWKAKA